MMTKQHLARFRTRLSHQASALLDLIAAKPRAVPLSARADIPQPKFDLTADPRAQSPASRTRHF